MSLTFQELVKLKNEVGKISEKKLLALALFHNPKNSFKNKKITRFLHFLRKGNPVLSKKERSRLSITSTVTCIKSLLIDHISDYDLDTFIEELYARFKDKELTTTGLEHGNAFTIGLLLPILPLIQSTKKNQQKKIITFCTAQAKKALSEGGIHIDGFPKQGYLTYYNLVGLQEIDQDVNVHDTYQVVLDWSKKELFKQISYFQSGDEEEADVFQLGYNLLILFRFCRSDLRESVIDLCLKIIFDVQLKRGVWEKRTPLFNYAKKGDAFPFSFELLNALFSEFQGFEDKFIPYEDQLLKTFDWTKKNARYHVVEGEKKNEIPLWKSVSRQEIIFAESWATSEVYLFLFYFKNYISKRLQKLVLTEFSGKRYIIPDENAFKGLNLPNVNLDENEIELDKLLKDKLLDPLKLSSKRKYSLVNQGNPDAMIRSGIFFGPPGTGKTTYAKRIAQYLGWPLVIVNPSDFAREGITLMPRVTSEIFEKLMELEDTVIFFDEMEELIKTRNEVTVFEQRFLTTTLLPKIQQLHDNSGSIFLVATNYLETIDEAAKRDGRFDFKIQILPPSEQSKLKFLKEELKKNKQEKKYQDIKDQLVSSSIIDSLKYSSRNEFKKLLQQFSDLKYDSKKVSEEIVKFSMTYYLKNRVDELRAADKKNVFEI